MQIRNKKSKNYTVLLTCVMFEYQLTTDHNKNKDQYQETTIQLHCIRKKTVLVALT